MADEVAYREREPRPRRIVVKIIALDEIVTTERPWVTVSSVGDKSERGYAPAIEKITEKETTLYHQTVESIDLPAVIAAVNSMKIAG